jgi:hypothetical protein
MTVCPASFGSDFGRESTIRPKGLEAVDANSMTQTTMMVTGIGLLLSDILEGLVF